MFHINKSQQELLDQYNEYGLKIEVSKEEQQTSLETINFEPNTVFCEGVHPYCFRSGKVSQVVSIERYNNRICFRVKFDDGIEDFIPLIDLQNYKVWGNG